MRAALLAALIAVSILSTAVLAQTGGSVDLEAVSVTAPGVLTAGSPVQLTAAINEKLLGGKSATIPAYTVKFQYRKASSGLGGIFGRLVAQIAYPTGQQVVSPGSTPVISGADLAVTDISFADSMLQVTILNKGTETAKFTTDDIKIGLQHLCVPQGGQCADNPVLTKRCTSLPGGSCTLKNPWGVTCTCNFKPFAAAKSYTLAAGQSTVVSIPNVPAPTGDSQLYATVNVPSLKEVNTADNTVKIKRTADGWTDIDGYDMSAHTITKTTQRKALKSWTPPAAGAWEVRATVDSDNKVKESNEKNNVQTKRFEVQALKPIGPQMGASCSDSDGGDSAFLSGSVTEIDSSGQKTVYTDFCLSSSKLNEFYCKGNTHTNRTVGCPNECKDGACVNATSKDTCNDTDGGKDLFTMGNVTGTKNGQPYNYFDSCTGDFNGTSFSKLNEYYCANNTWALLANQTCDNGCMNGACKK